MTAGSGKPDLVHQPTHFGAWPRSDNPYRTREPQNKPLLVAEKAEVRIPALNIEGSTGIEEADISVEFMLL